MDWAVSEGARLRVTISRNKDGIRGLFTTQDVNEGEELIYIPSHLVLSVKNAPASETAPVLLKEIHSPCSRLRPYMDVLPKPGGVLTGYNFPEEYVPYLGDQHMEEYVRRSFLTHVKNTWLGHNNDNMDMTLPEAVGRVNITLEEFQHAVSLVTSRTFSIRTAALSMVPVMDMANHDPRDINQLDNHLTDGVALLAGKDLKAGEEVTITYGNMRSDELLLYYGFIDTFTEPPRLLAVDHHQHQPYKAFESEEFQDFTGTPEEIREEIERLRNRLYLARGVRRAMGVMPTTVPYVASMLTQLHQQRERAIEHELNRLQVLLDAADKLEL